MGQLRSLNYLLVIIAILSTSCVKELPEKPNILFITTDYQAWEDIPEITRVLKMPAVDKLYKEGLVFENHYCTAPVCMPSRYTIVSGTYPHTHGLWDNSSKWLPEGSPLLMDELVKAGYKTVGIGKMHFKPWDRMAGFDERIIADCQGNWYRDTTKRDDYYYYLREAGFTRFDYLRYQDSTDLFGVYPWPLHDTLDIDYYVGDQTVKYIDNGRLPDDPWFLWVSFNGPHNPWDPPKELMDYYLERDLPEARFLESELDNKPFAHTITRYNYTRKIVDRIDQYPERRSEYIRRIRAGHYGGLTLIDMQIEKIFKKLEEEAQLDNTIIIFTADHGAHLGDHDNIHKGTLYERSSHVPFVIWWPGAIKPGRIKGFTSHVDLFPTLVELAGGNLPDGLEGKSYYKMLQGYEPAPDTAIIEILGNTALVTKDYKFGMYRQFKEGDLYDRNNDPNEFKNIITDPEYSNIAKELAEYLFEIDPSLKDDYNNAPDVMPLPETLTLRQGESSRGKASLYLGGKSFKIEVDMDISKGDDGPLLTHYEGQHGLSIFIANNTLKAGFRKWNKDQYFDIMELPAGKHLVCLEINQEGILKASLDNKSSGQWKTFWPKPVQAGRKEYLTGNINCGTSGPNRAKPIGEYVPGSKFSGKINLISITNIN